MRPLGKRLPSGALLPLAMRAISCQAIGARPNLTSDTMTALSLAQAQELAAIHSRSFTHPRPWTADELQLMAGSANHQLIYTPAVGFAVIQVVVDEAELLTIAVDPSQRRQGAGARLLDQAIAQSAERGAARMFLDVAADNVAAIALYQRAGFEMIGKRKNYYKHDGYAVDALLMERAISQN